MQALHVGIQALPQGLQSIRFQLPGFGIRRTASLPGRIQLGQYIGFARLVGVDLQAELSKSDLAQTSINHIQRCDLLRNEKDPLIQRNELGNHVDDRLALARSRRTNQHEISALGCRQYG
ncbi:hypothetical protein D3C85_1624090 [compost metagenome]